MKKNVLITGATGGIGSATARLLASRNYNLILAYKSNDTAAQQLYDELSHQCEVTLAKGDISLSSFVKDLFTLRVDALVNNAGISGFSLVQDTSDQAWETLLGTNLTGCFYTCREAVRRMQPRGEGAIVNVTSMWGQVGAAGEVAYSATKAGLIGLTKALAKEVGPAGIRVNAVAPGVIDTPMNAQLSKDTLALLASNTPLGRIGTSEETAAAIAFLLSDDAAFITGQVLSVNGGFVI